MAEHVVKPRMRGFIATNAHPDGCAANVRAQAEQAQRELPGEGLGATLVVGSSTGYGLATTLCACFGYGAPTLGVCFEREARGDRTASAGWYNLAEAHRLAREQGRMLRTINGDAFSRAIKAQVIDALREGAGPLDLLVYSLAAPRREGEDGTVWHSTLKPIGAPYTGKALDLRSDRVIETAIEPASDEEIAATEKVMGGEDWADWVHTLRDAGLLADRFRTVAYSYVGPEMTHPIYRAGTIGRAKEHLEAMAGTLAAELGGERAVVSVNAAAVTQASAAIPAVPLYVSLLFKVMQARGLHERTIDQIVRLFRDHIGPGATPSVDAEGRIRLDDRELGPEVQAEVAGLWQRVNTDNLRELSDYSGYQREFRRVFGFDVAGVDYDAPTELERELQ